MAIVGEPCNIDTHASIFALFLTVLCPRVCVPNIWVTRTRMGKLLDKCPFMIKYSRLVQVL